MTYTVMQVEGSAARYAAAVEFASSRGGTVTEPEETPRHVTVFKASFPIPILDDESMRDSAFAFCGTDLYLALCRAT